ncbi:MAG: hypothetical protein QOH29_657 [Actinomycetota bacterium]|jgi:hypothetical protein|nr:hypothetical protein [Actinomycetota bacterium]
MSEVLGDAEPHDDTFDARYDERDPDDRDLDESFDDTAHRSSVTDLLDTVGSPAALAITALAVSALSLVGLLSSYGLASALTVSNDNSSPLFAERANSGVQLGLGVLGAILALVAHWAAVKAEAIDSAPQRGPRAMAGAALLLSAVSIAQSVAALVIMVGANPQTG